MFENATASTNEENIYSILVQMFNIALAQTVEDHACHIAMKDLTGA